jgi:hypothetical protein
MIGIEVKNQASILIVTNFACICRLRVRSFGLMDWLSSDLSYEYPDLIATKKAKM